MAQIQLSRKNSQVLLAYRRFSPTTTEELLIRYWVTQIGLQEILAQSCWGLICHLYTIL